MPDQTQANHFAEKFRIPLEALNWSRARCARELSVDKSVISRWASGRATPTEHNLTRFTALIQQVLPRFRASAWRLDTASFATLGDVLIAEPGALIGFAGPRVIENAVRQPLPEGFQTAEYLLAHGMLDCVEPREGLPALLGMLLRAYRSDGHDAAGSDIVAPRLPEDGQPPWSDATELAAASAARLLRDARAIGRPTTLEYAWRIFDEFVELHGDRLAGDDPAMVGGLGRLDGCWAVVLGHQKGNDTASLIARNFGMARPEGYRKATRLMRLAQRLRLPVLTFVDTQGAAPDISAEAWLGATGCAWDDTRSSRISAVSASTSLRTAQ